MRLTSVLALLALALTTAPAQADPVDCSQPSGENFQCHAEVWKCRADALGDGQVRLVCQPTDGKSRCIFQAPDFVAQCRDRPLLP